MNPQAIADSIDTAVPTAPKTAVLIPCYNEATTIQSVVRSYRELLPDPNTATIYVYDNNSTDDTADLARAAGAVVVSEYRQGKGYVVRSMFRDIEADVYLMVDGDDTYEASDVVALAADVIDGRADMVVGDRLSSTYFQENKRAFHGAGNRLVRWLINKIFRNEIRDVMTGARAFSRRFVKTYPSLIGGFEIETEMTIHALDKDFLITQRNVTYRDRPAGSTSKLDTIPDGLRVLKTIFALFKDFRPLAFFGLASLILLAIAFALFLVPFIEYLETGFVSRFPTLIVSVAIAVMSLLSGACGIIVDSIRKQTRTFFEIELTRVAQMR
ncbi:MAG: glycosyltransferase family 2 protein [Actinomycetes bacterium]|jgi:glycosyltransferase involved in cell wall biosynthesis|nr:glycosyltransferase family 2 protein [Actinomycetes bacterium]